MDRYPTKCHDGVPLLEGRKVFANGLVHGLERTQSLVSVHVAIIPHTSTERLYELHGSLLAAKVHFFRLDAKQRLSPRPPTVRVANHLDLVDHGNVNARI